MNLIALETSNSVASIALWTKGRVRCEHILDGPMTHSQTLLPMLQNCLEKTALDWVDFDAIACNVGPGSFTGLRIGVSTANALAFAQNLRRVAVDSLEALAYQVTPSCASLIIPMIDARSDRIYAAAYRQTHGGLETVLAPQASNITDWLAQLPQADSYLLLGDGAERHLGGYQEHFGAKAGVFVCPPHSLHHRAGALAYAAWKKAEQGAFVDSLLPLYLRPSQAEQERNGQIG